MKSVKQTGKMYFESLWRRAFEEWLQRRDRVTYDRYRAQRVAVKLQSKLQKEWRTGDGESDWGMISMVPKRCFGKK